MKTIEKGDLTVLAIATALAKRGERILIPFSQAERYDLALDRAGTLYRIQCKTGRMRKGAVLFKACSHGPRSTLRRYGGEIEAFGVYCREIDRCFLVPIEAVAGVSRVALRIESRTHQRTIRYATDFAI